MNLTGGHTILILNLCGLLMAFIVSAETAFVLYKIGEYIHHVYIWMPFVPVIIMFIVRHKIFSSAFLLLYVLLSVLISAQIWLMQTGTPVHNTGNFIGFFFIISLFCLFIYIVISIFRFFAKLWRE
jgi:hypothetical protein